MVTLNSNRSERRIMDASSTFSYRRTRAYKLLNNTLFDLFSKRKTLSSPTYKNGLNVHPNRGLRCFRILLNIKFILFKASPTERKRSLQLVPLQFAKKLWHSLFYVEDNTRFISRHSWLEHCNNSLSKNCWFLTTFKLQNEVPNDRGTIKVLDIIKTMSTSTRTPCAKV